MKILLWLLVAQGFRTGSSSLRINPFTPPGWSIARTIMRKLLSLLLVQGFGLVPSVAFAEGPPPLGQEARSILQAQCAGCHGGGKAAKGGFGFILDRDRLLSPGL